MLRSSGLVLAAVLALAACEAPTPTLGPDGKPLPRAVKIRPGQEGEVQYRMLDSVNALRSAAGAPALQLDPRLNAAAATHSRDMAVQNRPWHFGSDGSSPLDRARRAGYTGMLLGENISETYETELETLSAWMAVSDTRAVLLDRSATNLGFAWYQEDGGKTWWTLITGN